jgi:hypothetical protein
MRVIGEFKTMLLSDISGGRKASNTIATDLPGAEGSQIIINIIKRRIL